MSFVEKHNHASKFRLQTITSTNTNHLMLDTLIMCFKHTTNVCTSLTFWHTHAPFKTHHCHTPCSVRYPCLRPVRPPGTTPRTGRTPPSLLHGFYRNPLHRPSCLPPLVTLATQVAASAHKAGATDAASLNIAALGDWAMRAAVAGQTLLTLSIPPAVRLDQSQCRGVEGGHRGGDQWEWASRMNKKQTKHTKNN